MLAALWPLIGQMLTILPSHWSEEASLYSEERVITAITSSSLGGNIGDNMSNISSEACNKSESLNLFYLEICCVNFVVIYCTLIFSTAIHCHRLLEVGSQSCRLQLLE